MRGYLLEIFLCKQIKKIEKNNAYKKKSNWPLKELKLVDGLDGNKVNVIILTV